MLCVQCADIGHTRDPYIQLGFFLKISDKIVLVLDNLSTHKENSLIKTFGSKEGKEIWDRFEVHYTPVHASWLNQAEMAIAKLSRQCLGRGRPQNIARLKGKIRCWTKQTNSRPVPSNVATAK